MHVERSRADLLGWGSPRRPTDARTSVGAVPGVVLIVIALLLIPVLVLMSGGVAAGVLGFFLGRDADARHAGSELLELDD